MNGNIASRLAFVGGVALMSCGLLRPLAAQTGFPVTMVTPREPMWVGSYARVPVRVARGLRFDFDDLDFRVAEGRAGGVVSLSRDKTFDRNNEHIMLIAGHAPGDYTLEAWLPDQAEPVARAPFRVWVRHPDPHLGPSHVYQGRDNVSTTGSTWGGGPSGLQNVSTVPALGTRRIALVFVDTTSKQFSTAAGVMDALKAEWTQHIATGFTSGGETWSARRFYDEASGGLFDLQLDVFGPYHLSGEWKTHGKLAGFDVHAQAAITAADADIDYDDVDTVLVVSKSVSDLTDTSTDDSGYAWPKATIPTGSYVTDEGTLHLGVIEMPDDWEDRQPLKHIYGTVSHELGHNLGLVDEYEPHVSNLMVNWWEIMSYEYSLPNFTLPNRMRLGWVSPSAVKSFNFLSLLGAPVDETVTLRPVSAGAPAAGSFVGIELRVADGRNYYLEHRRADPSWLADRALSPTNSVLGIDVIPTPTGVRPDLLLLPEVPLDSTGVSVAAMTNGKSYEETDTTTPGYPADFRIDVSGIDAAGTKADVRIRYANNLTPDPSITPWGAPPWQTPDIEVRNARNAADPTWFNVPWAEHDNDVIAKVKNGGTLDAPGVKVNFFAKDYSGGSVPEAFLGSDTRDVPRGTTVEFSTLWIPANDGHICIRVEIEPHSAPGAPGSPAVPEITTTNNDAQSNYNQFISASASPPWREMTEFVVGNPFDEETRVHIHVRQTNPFYRTYLQHRWLDVPAHESARVAVMYEYVGQLTHPGVQDDSLLELERAPNLVSIAVWADNPGDELNHHQVLLGGAGGSVLTGRATSFARFGVQNGIAEGAVVTGDGEPVPGGQIIFTATTGEGKNARRTTQTEPLHGGEFRVQLRIEGETLEAYYLPLPGFGDATSATVELE